MIVAIIDTCDLTRYLHYTIIKSIDSNSHVYKYKSIEQFLDDMINPKIKLPDYILTAYNVCSLNAMNLINSVEEFRLKNKYQKEIKSSGRSIVLNFYNFYSENFGTNYKDAWSRSILKTTVPEEFLNEKSIIWINFDDTKTLDEIKQISEYTIKPISD